MLLGPKDGIYIVNFQVYRTILHSNYRVAFIILNTWCLFNTLNIVYIQLIGSEPDVLGKKRRFFFAIS